MSKNEILKKVLAKICENRPFLDKSSRFYFCFLKVVTEKNIFIFENNLGVFSVTKVSDKMVTEKTPNNLEIFECVICDFKCSKKSDWRRHTSTRKHEKRVNGDSLAPNCIVYTCAKCLKIYESRNGLWTHKKKGCEEIKKVNQIDTLTNLVIEIIKQNQELTKQLIETSKPSYITNNNCINTTTNKFNLNFFLNDHCKDAINISEFVDSLNLSLNDLEQVGTQGFTSGISNIFVNGLKELDISKRPVHCSDLKREILYIKDEDRWEKDDLDKHKLTKAIKQVAHKNIQQIQHWVKENPNCKDAQSVKNDEYLQLISNSMGASTLQEEETNVKIIIKNIAKEVIIDK